MECLAFFNKKQGLFEPKQSPSRNDYGRTKKWNVGDFIEEFMVDSNSFAFSFRKLQFWNGTVGWSGIACCDWSLWSRHCGSADG